jgi:hypothetical protein
VANILSICSSDGVIHARKVSFTLDALVPSNEINRTEDLPFDEAPKE